MNDTDYAGIARDAGLTRIGVRPPFGSYLVQVWQRRAFAITLAGYRIQAENQENRLGLVWVVLRPLLNAVVYGLIFGVGLKTANSTGDVPFIPFLIIGVFIFEYFSDSFSAGARAVLGNQALVKSLSFPRLLLPISMVLQSLFELVPMLLIMIAIVLLAGVPIGIGWLVLIPVLALMTLFNAGVAFMAARITAHFPDFRQVLQLITRIGFYTTGVFFALEGVVSGTLLTIARLNPVHDYISLIRWGMLPGSSYDPIFWVNGTVGAVVFFVGGLVYFWRAEETYGRD
ncbi:MAG: ABC transporter permease [Microbacteriaceae bacterium]